MAHLSLSPSLFPGWDNEAWNQRGQSARCFSQLQSFMKERVAKLDVGLAVWSWIQTAVPFLFPPVFHLPLDPGAVKKGKGEGDRWKVCVAGVAW